jgi:starch synthase (maltosyl-transferring)
VRRDGSLRFHAIENDQILAYSKRTADLANAILIIVNLDPHRTQSGWVDVEIDELDLAEDEEYEVHDLLSEARYLWRGRRNFVMLDPSSQPAHVFRVNRPMRASDDRSRWSAPSV